MALFGISEGEISYTWLADTTPIWEEEGFKKSS